MGVQTAAANFVASRLGHNGLAEARQQRSHQHDAPAEGSRLLAELRALQHLEVHLVGLELEGAAALASRRHVLADIHAEEFQEVYQFVDIADVRHMLYANLLGGEEHGAEHLQGLVLGSLRHYLAFELAPAYDFKTAHFFFFFFFFFSPASFLAATAAIASR